MTFVANSTNLLDIHVESLANPNFRCQGLVWEKFQAPLIQETSVLLELRDWNLGLQYSVDLLFFVFLNKLILMIGS